MSSKNKNSRSRSRTRKARDASRIPNVYPTVPGYSIPAPQWLPPQPYQWYQPMSNLPPMPNANVPWMTHSPGQTPTTISSKAVQPDEFTVDSLRRIYNNDDGSIEIERVKVQRRQGIYDTKQGAMGYASESQSIVPVSHFLNERRPPPRKHKKKDAIVHKQDETIPVQGWYPYMPYIPQPFPYGYPYGYVWPVPSHSPIGMHAHIHSPTDDSDSSASHHEPFSVSIDSPILPTKSLSPESRRPPSSATGSHIAESLGTDIAPSDSVSMRGFKRETSFERILRKSFADSKDSDKASETLTSKDIEKTKEWMEGMQKAFESKSGFSSEVTGDRSSFTTAPSDIPTPPPKTKILKNSKSRVILTHRKSNSESNIDDHEEQKNTSSLPLLENTRVSESDLKYAIDNNDSNRAERFQGTVEHRNELTEDNVAKMKQMSDNGGRDSRTSTTSFHSTRQSADENLIDTDSTDIAIPLDSSTAEESVENFEDETISENIRNKNYTWILQNNEDLSSDDDQKEDGNTSEIIESWRTEVSMWRARLVVSLCRGQGLDQQDWGTFNLLVQHPLSLDMKLSLLHAPRLCAQNYDVGVALLRNALLHLTTFGETLMKPDNERTQGWKTITIDSNQPWVLIKGSLEILRVFGFRIRGNGTLRFRQKYSPEISVTARLTLDMLVLAEEFRLFLNGAHHYPVNITQLFTTSRDFQYEKTFHVHSPATHDISDSRKSESKIDSSISSFQSESELKHLIGEQVQVNTNVTPLPSVSVIENIPSDNLNDLNEKIIQPSSEISIPAKENLSDDTSSNNLAVNESSDRDSGSRETLVPTPTPQEEDIVSKNIKEDTESSSGKKTKRTINGKDNPEEHVYEEIGDIKEQVEHLRQSESSSRSPPPLPPKTKSSQNDDLYPQVDWSISSQYSSLQGSTSRRKKRRAPMPPEFLLSDTKDTENDEQSHKENVSRTSASEIERSEVNKNPFYEERVKPAGYVGKNPFYEDLETSVKKDTGKLKSQEVSVSSSEINEAGKEHFHTNTLKSAISFDDISEVSTCSTLPAGVRPQRRKKKKNIVKTQNDEIATAPTISTPKDTVTLHLETVQPEIQPNKEQLKSLPKQTNVTKNDARKQQCSSQVVVSNENETTASTQEAEPKATEKKDVIFQKISITYDIRLDDTAVKVTESKVPKNHQVIDGLKIEENIKEVDLTLSRDKKLNSKEVVSDTPTVNGLKIEENIKEVDLTLSRDKKLNSKEVVSDTPTVNGLKIEENIKEVDLTLSRDKTLSDSKVVSETATVNEILAEPSADNTKIKPNSDSSHLYSKVHKEKIEKSGTKESPPLLPPKSTLRLIDDIPYIDSNDVKNYKRNYLTSERQQPPHYGLSELNPDKVTDLSISNSQGKMSTFLKRSSFVPFIDDSDLPPDSNPPSPPPSPPLPPPSPPLLSLNSVEISDSLQFTPSESSTEEPSVISSETLTKPAQLLSNENSQVSISSDSVTADTLSNTVLPSANLQKTNNSQIASTDISSLEKTTVPPSPPHSPPPPSPESLLSSSEKDKISSEDYHVNQDKIQDTEDLSFKDEKPILDSGLEGISEAKEEFNHLTLDVNTTDNESKKDDESSVTKDQEDEDSERKSLVMFKTEISSEDDAIKQDLGSPQYEIPEASKVLEDTEERYEIPNVAKSNAMSQLPPIKQVSVNQTASKTSKETKLKTENNEVPPKRPPRHQLSFKVPPPRPPKPENIPPLPPKTGSLKSSKSSVASSQQSSSLPSTLVKISHNGKKVQPSPLAIPTMYKSNPDTISKSKEVSNKASSLSSIPTGQSKKKESSLSDKKSLPKSSKPSSTSASLPSSPKATKPKSFFRKDSTDKKQISWPSLLCDCVHPTGSNDDIKYVIK